MSKKTYNNHDEFVAEAIKRYGYYKIFRFWVDHNPFGSGKRTLLKGYIGDEILNTWGNAQDEIDGIDYAFGKMWRDDYTGTFTFAEDVEEVKQEEKNTSIKKGDKIWVELEVKNIAYDYIQTTDLTRFSYDQIKKHIPELKVGDMVEYLGLKYKIEFIKGKYAAVSYQGEICETNILLSKIKKI